MTGGNPLVPMVRCYGDRSTKIFYGGHDEPVIEMNQVAYDLLTCEKRLIIVPGATHLFEEPGTLEQVAEHASRWFGWQLQSPDIRS